MGRQDRDRAVHRGCAVPRPKWVSTRSVLGEGVGVWRWEKTHWAVSTPRKCRLVKFGEVGAMREKAPWRPRPMRGGEGA